MELRSNWGAKISALSCGSQTGSTEILPMGGKLEGYKLLMTSARDRYIRQLMVDSVKRSSLKPTKRFLTLFGQRAFVPSLYKVLAWVCERRQRRNAGRFQRTRLLVWLNFSEASALPDLRKCEVGRFIP